MLNLTLVIYSFNSRNRNHFQIFLVRQYLVVRKSFLDSNNYPIFISITAFNAFYYMVGFLH